MTLASQAPASSHDIFKSNTIRLIIGSSAGGAQDLWGALRDGFMKTMKDPALLADAAKRKWEVDPLTGDTLATIAKEIIAQPPEVIDRLSFSQPASHKGD